MSYLNTSTNHPIIENAQEYTVEKKYVSIHSEDRNMLKFPNPSDFEIELPQDYINVSTVKLSSWSFPSNFDLISPINQNNVMTFHFVDLYNPDNLLNTPNEMPGVFYELQKLIYQYLSCYINPITNTNDFIITIESGFYDPWQMAKEVTNKMNSVVTNYLTEHLQNHDDINDTTFNAQFLNYQNGIIYGGYKDFVVAYNEVEQKLWFGNRSSCFSLTQNKQVIYNYYSQQNCSPENKCNPQNNSRPQNNNILPENLQPYPYGTCANLESTQSSFIDPYINGLPFYLGLSACILESQIVIEPHIYPNTIPRFFYKDVSCSYWLAANPELIGSSMSYIQSPAKINILGPPYFYIDITGLNYLDETSPFNVSQFTIQRNQTNSIVNSSFAKIGITTTPLSQFYDTTIMDSYKYFNPPAERIRKLKIKLRYHNGQYVIFNNSSFSFTLEFTVFKPQILRNMVATKSYTSL
jgi:hypothetical protein